MLELKKRKFEKYWSFTFFFEQKQLSGSSVIINKDYEVSCTILNY